MPWHPPLALALPLLILAYAPTPARAEPQAHVRLLATGGTIAGSGEAASASYRAGIVPIGDILRAVPGLEDVATISAEQVANIGSYDMSEPVWRKLAARAAAAGADPAITGVVVTHGTDTIEETAFFLSLVLPSTKPVVLVGSMRPGTAVSADGAQNLLDAVRLASAADACGRGVMLVMNDTIFAPAFATKSDIRRVNAFAAPARGPAGDMLTDRPRFFAAGVAPREAAFALGEAELPKVAIAYAYAGMTGDDIRAAAKGARGLVIAGVGAGSFPASAREAVKELTAKGFPVVRTARQGTGDVWINPPSMGDISDQVLGTIAGRELTPAKARILLMLALQTPRGRPDLQALFDRYGTM